MQFRGGAPGFTLAEVLITIGIIGVVAALTIPNLISNHKKQTTETALKKYNSILNQTLIHSEVDNGSAVNWDWNTNESDMFFAKYFAPYIGVVKGQKASIPGVGLYYKVYNSLGEIPWEYNNTNYFKTVWYQLPDGGAVSFSLNHTYNPNLFTGYFTVIIPNGSNRSHLVIGRDVFQFMVSHSVNGDDFKIEPDVFMWSCSQIDEQRSMINERCRGENLGSSGLPQAEYCTKLLACNGWKIPHDYPVRF